MPRRLGGSECRVLFDADLSPKLVGRLVELFPGSVHVFDTGLVRHISDETIWEYAGANSSTIVTADSDFLDLAEARGTPPKVVQLENCNYRPLRLKGFCGDTPFGSWNWSGRRGGPSSFEARPEAGRAP